MSLWEIYGKGGDTHDPAGGSIYGERFREQTKFQVSVARRFQISGVGSLKSTEIRKLLSLVNARLRLYTKHKRLALPGQVAAGAMSRWRAEKCASFSVPRLLSLSPSLLPCATFYKSH